MSTRSCGYLPSQGCAQKTKSGVKKGHQSKKRPINRKGLQPKAMGSESMKLGSDSCKHKPRSVPKIGPISSCMMQDVSVPQKGYAGEIKIAAAVKIRGLILSTVLTASYSDCFLFAPCLLPCTSLLFGDGGRK